MNIRILATGLLSIVIALSAVSAGAVTDWERKDNATRCDEIGWNLTLQAYAEMDDTDELEFYASCVHGVAYVAMCGTVAGSGYLKPDAGDVWITCHIIAMNMSTSSQSVTFMDFALVSDSGRKYDTDFLAMTSFDASDMFPSQTLREGQSVDGYIAFAIPRSSSLPLILEIDPMLSFSYFDSDVGEIVIPEMVRLGS